MGYLTDDSPMPFGKYRDKPMSEVPASYLLWLWNNQKKGFNEVKLYIRENLEALKAEVERDKKNRDH